MTSTMNFEINTVTIIIGIFGYMCIFVLFINIMDVILSKPAQIVEYSYCTEGKCKNKSFAKTEFCYWHHPMREALSPIGSEVTPRRSLRIALQNQGMCVVFPEESKVI